MYKMCVFLQLATGPRIKAEGRQAFDALLAGIAFHYTKPILAAEVRHIFPTTVGLPMELSFYTAAVANAAVERKFRLPFDVSQKFFNLLNREIEYNTFTSQSRQL